MNRRRGRLLGRSTWRFPPFPALLLAPLFLSGCYLGPRPTSTATIVAAAPDATTLLLIEAAKSDQRNFEIFRRSTLPLAIGALSGSFTCTEKVGLYCIDRVMGGLARMTSHEVPEVTAARDQLIETLQAANRRMPSDGWIQGQIVRYLVEGGNMAVASAAAANCQAEPQWWCFALAGYVYHHSGFGAAAHEAYQVALGAMPVEERAQWLDISALLHPEVVSEYALLEPGEASNFEERFWFLADPLLTRSGNEVLNEHLTRRVELILQLDAETVEGPLRDRDALETIGRHDLLVRYGLPDRWVRGMGKMGTVQILSRAESPSCTGGVDVCGASNYLFTVRAAESGEIADVRGAWEARGAPVRGSGAGLLAPPLGVRDLVAYYAVPPQDLLPPPGILLAERGPSDEEVELTREWDLLPEVAQTAFSIRMEGGTANWIAPLSHQVASFSRGDSAVVVAGYDLPAHGVSSTAQVGAGVAILPMEDLHGPPVVEVVDLASAAGVLVLRASARPSLISVEAVVPEELSIARARYEIDLAPVPLFRFAISDLLFLHGSEEEMRSPEEAATIARGSARVAPGEFMGVYWELYGLDPAVSPEVTMSLLLRRSPSGIVAGALRWLGDVVGLVGDPDPVRVEWVEEVAAGDWMGRSLSFLVPADAGGRYTLILTARVPGREPVIATRELEITDSTISPPRAGTLVRRPNLTRPTRCIPETTIETSAFLVADAMSYSRTPRCAFIADPSWFGHYGGSDHLSEYGYDGW